MNLNSLEGATSVEWMQGSLVEQSQQPLTWFRVGNKASKFSFLSAITKITIKRDISSSGIF